ncbi:hypothetical protein [Pseudobacteriovorax antillogorgiicola]|uniref:Uncharacterized protein n=1 Tax=Pseudobacteriovorax antillogorgiicola TaxID=1513793 RepID=A0A1Y6C7D9_9BACT|nr:hypothetical protein [Pseudobacteriovorax antillogorgiicola]TCS49341.1 hypothetical protein EDD56_11521 [Pseudobacteriovorax antillogorgiicola]SMF47879.1 hypothetical protein SAMN06296036_114163 [Pseudobacteriovorax antillogorgiicola]
MISHKSLIRTSTVLWVIWGLVHAFAGIMTITQDIPNAIAGIADGVDPSILQMSYPDAVGGILGQHGWNLLWFGVATTIGGVFMWRGSVTSIFVTAMIGGLADIGYFLFMDLGGFVNFVPGTVMTLICASAIVLSFVAHYRFRDE